MNVDGSHHVLVRYLGPATEPRCFRDTRFVPLKKYYSHQTNFWMDSDQLSRWLTWWYGEVRKCTTEDVLLIKDKFGGHECNIEVPGIRLELLLPKSTNKFQNLDLGIIVHSKIRYRTISQWNSG